MLTYLLSHKWDKYAKKEFKKEAWTFFIIFCMASFNTLFFFVERSSSKKSVNHCLSEKFMIYEAIGSILDCVIFIYILYMVYCELLQLISFYQNNKIKNYYQSFWNWIDWITLILLGMTVLFDILSIFCIFKDFVSLRVLHTVSLFFIWLKLLGFFRIDAQFSAFVQMFLQVIVDMKNFLIFMFYLVMAFTISCK